MRYELKMRFPEAQTNAVVDQLLLGRFCICTKYPPRQVNNIYFDQPFFDDYYENLNGASSRNKYRIRWYGQCIGSVSSPMLENKHKEGNVGEKITVQLPGFDFQEGFQYENYLKKLAAISQCEETHEQARQLLFQLGLRTPVLVNSYMRRYLHTFDDVVTITVDETQRYWLPNDALRPNATMRAIVCPETVVEFKFDEGNAPLAEQIISDLGFRINRNSKYVTGVQLLYSI